MLRRTARAGLVTDAYWEFDRGYQDGRDNAYTGLAAQRVSRDCEIGDFHCRGYDEASTRVSDAIRYGDNEWDLLGADYGYSLGFALGETGAEFDPGYWMGLPERNGEQTFGGFSNGHQ